MAIDTDYYRQRADSERRAAEASADVTARRAQEALAERYDRLLAGEELKLGIVERN